MYNFYINAINYAPTIRAANKALECSRICHDLTSAQRVAILDTYIEWVRV